MVEVEVVVEVVEVEVVEYEIEVVKVEVVVISLVSSNAFLRARPSSLNLGHFSNWHRYKLWLLTVK